MNKLIYSVYFILPLIFFWRAKPVIGRGKWNNEFLSLKQTKALQGFLAICIMLHHIAQKTCASWLFPKSRIIPGLEIFAPNGYLFVAVFLFFNGYGIYKSYSSKPNYLNGFVKKRILPVVLSLYTTGLIFFIARLILGEKMNGSQMALYLSSIKLCNPNTWYVIVLPFFYLAFYLSFKFFKNKDTAFFTSVLFVVVYMLAATRVDHNDYWIRGEWWYNCVHLFPIGMIFAKFENRIVPHLKRHYLLYLILAFGLFYPLYLRSDYVLNIVSYYGENFNALDKVFRRRICLLSQMYVTCDFVFCFLLLSMKVKIGNKLLDFMGKITLEFYLIHGLFVELFDHEFCSVVPAPLPIKNVFLYVVAVYALGIPSALLLQKLHHIILRTNKKKTDINKNIEKKTA